MNTDDDDCQRSMLKGAVGWQKRRRETASRFGESADQYFKVRLKGMKRNAAVVDAWDEIIGRGLGEHCRLVSISGGVLRLEVEAGPYMHEVKLMSSELLERLRGKCPTAGIRKIKMSPMGGDVSL